MLLRSPLALLVNGMRDAQVSTRAGLCAKIVARSKRDKDHTIVDSSPDMPRPGEWLRGEIGGESVDLRFARKSPGIRQ